VSQSEGPHSSDRDVRTLAAFLADEQADWKALSRELASLSRKTQDAPAREALSTLADYLAHADRSAGMPREVREFLETQEGQLAASVFRRAMEHDRAWRDFAKEAERLLGEEGA
jgi:hypothetical protein